MVPPPALPFANFVLSEIDAMAYCTISDVQALVGVTYNDTTPTKPSATQVNKFIDQVFAEMFRRFTARQIDVDAILTNAEAKNHVLQINAIGAAAKAVGAMFTGTSPNESTHMRRLLTEFEDKMSAIDADPGILVDAETVEEGPLFFPTSTTGQLIPVKRDTQDEDNSSGLF